MAVIGVSSSAFVGQNTITSVKFGSTCTYVGKDAFKKCTSLEKINDDNVIEKIYDGAFASTKLSSVNFSKLKSIIGSIGTSGAFEKCSCLTDINIPSCNNIGIKAFANCENLKNVKINNLFDGNTISINTSAFYGCRNLENIDFKNCLRIGNQAFAGCTSIENADLNKCISIGSSAFWGCTKLKEIKLSSCIIGSYAFLNCNNLSIVYINTTSEQSCITLNGDNIFYNYIGLPIGGTYSIISNIRFYLGADIFDKYEKDEKWSVYKDYMIKFPYGNQIIYTTNNDKIIDTDSDSDYSDSDQYNEYGIDTQTYDNFGLITFKENITSLNKVIFKGNKKITSIILPSECTEIGKCEFEGCESLDTFKQLPSNTLTTIEDCAFKDCISLKSFEISESVTSIGDYAFEGCDKITSITLPSNLTELGNFCFATTPKTKVYIPHSLTTPPIFTISGNASDSSYPFGNTNSDINYIPKEHIPQIFVPSDFEDIYINDKYWGKYKEYIKTY